MLDERSGTCLCGVVTFEIRLPPRFVAHCHCRNCQRAHGAGVVTWVGVPDQQFRIVTGHDALTVYHTATDAYRQFCSTCGSSLFYSSERWPEEVHVAAATIDGEIPDPTVHVYADRSPTWCPITDSLPQRGGESGADPLE